MSPSSDSPTTGSNRSRRKCSPEHGSTVRTGSRWPPPTTCSGVGRLANLVRERLHGDVTYFNINRHLNPTNVCVASCRLCAFYVPWRDRERGWTWTVEQAVEVAARDLDETVTELHIVGGLHPKLKVEYYEAAVPGAQEPLPLGPPQGADHGRARLPRLAGPDHRGGRDRPARARPASARARAAAPRSSRRGCASRSATTRPTATAGSRSPASVHRAGLRSNCTMLYGHVETRRGAGRPPARPARAAGRDRRLPVLHPARLPPRQHSPRHTCPRPAAGSTSRPSPLRPAAARQHRRTSRPTGSCSARRSRRSPSTSAPTTSTAP